MIRGDEQIWERMPSVTGNVVDWLLDPKLIFQIRSD